MRRRLKVLGGRGRIRRSHGRRARSVWSDRTRRLWDSGAPPPLLMVALVMVTSHAALIWHHAVPDFDTDTLRKLAESGCDPNWVRKGMGDSAHPLSNALIPYFECHFAGSGWPSPAQSWYLVLTIAVVVIIGLLWAAAGITGGGDVRAALAVAYLGLSPAMRTMSTRANEKWIGVTLFLVVVLAMLSFHRAPGLSRARVLFLVGASIVLGLWHTQYLIILGVALGLWGLVALISPNSVATTRAKAVTLGASVLVPPAVVVGVMTWTGYVTNVAYQEHFLSVFNDNAWHGPVPWIRDFLAYTARWLPGWLQDEGAQEVMFPPPHGASFVILGVLGLALFLALAASTRNTLLGAIAVGCVALPFLYEPDNAERWDAASVILALCLAVGGFARDRPSSLEDPEAASAR